MDKIARIKDLTARLNLYRDAYYNKSESLISDKEYDDLFDELSLLEEETGVQMTNSPTLTVGYEVVSELEKVQHSHPMLSLAKTKSIDELTKFAGNKDCLLSLKLDGLTVLLTYENGELVQAETRGNGEIGEIITHNARVFENIPLTIDYKGNLEIEGEAIITYDDFERINNQLPDGEKYKNPRNLVSGSVRQLDNEVAAQRHIKFVTWKVPKIKNEKGLINSYAERIEAVKRLGFDIVPYQIINRGNVSDLENLIESLKKLAQELLTPIDGLVFTYNDIVYGNSLGMTGHHPRHSIAFKFYDEEVETVLRDVEWSMGKTGCLTPVAIFDPVEIDGTIVERASLHNLTMLQEVLGEVPYVGQKISVYKANMIIPQISSGVKYKELGKEIHFASDGYFWVDDENKYYDIITIPDECPICGELTKIVKDKDTKVIMCSNPDCKGKLLGKLSHSVSKNALDIDGMSEATIQFLIDKGWVTNIQDLYHLNRVKASWMNCEGFGKRSVEKLLGNIEKSRKTTMAQILYAQSIPLIGRTASKDISKHCNNDVQTFVNFMNDDYDFSCIDGFGIEMQKSLSNWWNGNNNAFISLINEFILPVAEETKIEGADLSGLTFVITGSLNHFSNRDELKDKLENLGAKVSGSVSAKTSFLINNDINSTSGKNKKARDLGIKIISEDEILEMIK